MNWRLSRSSFLLQAVLGERGFGCFFGRPSNRTLCSKCSWLAGRLTQRFPRYGWPLSARTRIGSSRARLSAVLTRAVLSSGRSTGEHDNNPLSVASSRCVLALGLPRRDRSAFRN
jgi:hypothetical protein